MLVCAHTLNIYNFKTVQNPSSMIQSLLIQCLRYEKYLKFFNCQSVSWKTCVCMSVWSSKVNIRCFSSVALHLYLLTDCMCVCLEPRGQHWVSSFTVVCLIFGTWLTLNPVLTDWLNCEFQRSAGLFTSAGVTRTHHYAQLSVYSWGFKLRSSCLHRRNFTEWVTSPAPDATLNCTTKLTM